jgi:hypothetical protein
MSEKGRQGLPLPAPPITLHGHPRIIEITAHSSNFMTMLTQEETFKAKIAANDKRAAAVVLVDSDGYAGRHFLYM